MVGSQRRDAPGTAAILGGADTERVRPIVGPAILLPGADQRQMRLSDRPGIDGDRGLDLRIGVVNEPAGCLAAGIRAEAGDAREREVGGAGRRDTEGDTATQDEEQHKQDARATQQVHDSSGFPWDGCRLV